MLLHPFQKCRIQACIPHSRSRARHGGCKGSDTNTNRDGTTMHPTLNMTSGSSSDQDAEPPELDQEFHKPHKMGPQKTAETSGSYEPCFLESS